jgi:hypothetical protein
MEARRRRWWWWWCGPALAAWLLGAAPAAIAGIDDDETQPPPVPDAAWIVRIPPQANVVIDENGNIAAYDDPANPALTCRSVLECWGVWTQSISGIALFPTDAASDTLDTEAPRPGAPE